MCGVTAAWCEADGDAEEWVRWSLPRLRTRGPDDEGLWAAPQTPHAPVLGHTLLSLHGRGSSRQPILSPGGVIVAANAEIYNHERWRHLRPCAGLVSDCAVLPGLLDTDDDVDDVLCQFDGDFAIVAWDPRRAVLHLVRDRFGIRPVSFRVDGNDVFVSSEEAVTAAGPDRSPRVDRREAMAQAVGAVTARRSLYEAVQVLRPGERIEFRRHDGRLTLRRRFWASRTWSPDGSGPDGLADACIEAVGTRARTHRRAVVYLSGGIDSAAVAAAAARSGVCDEAWSVAFPGDADATHAAAIASSLGLRHRVVPVDAAAIFDRYEDAVRRAGHLISNPVGVARLLLSEAASAAGVAVALTGELADELFGGYPMSQVDLALATGVDGSAVYRRFGLSGPPVEEREIDERWDNAIGFTPTWLRTWLHAAGELSELWSAETYSSFRPADVFGEMLESLDLPEAHPFDRAGEAWIQTVFERRVGGWATERMDASCGLEGRPVFAAAPIVAVASRLAPHQRTSVGVAKHGLRDGLRGLVPEEVRARPKHAFSAPTGIGPGGFAPGLVTLVERYLAPDAVRAVGLVDEGALVALLERSRAASGYEQRRLGRLVHQLLSLHVLFLT